MVDPAQQPSNRREFLQGKAAARALESLLPAESRLPLPAGVAPGRLLLQLGRSAMACQFEVLLNMHQYPQGPAAGLAGLDLVEQLETQLTVYRDTSEVMEINRTAASEAVPVEPGLWQLFQQSLGLWEATGGAFDITSGPLSRVWGFSRRQGRVPDAAELAEARDRVGSQWLELDTDSHRVRFRHPQLEVNFNSIGKGYAIDRCGQRLDEAGVGDFLIHGGHSSVLARGGRSGVASGGWRIALRDPLKPDRRLAELLLADTALATSGSANQFFYHQGRRYSHVLDPRSGWPAEGVLSVSVLASTAAEADALATAFFVLGPDAAETYCRQRPELAWIMIVPGSRRGSRCLVTCRMEWLTTDGWQSAPQRIDPLPPELASRCWFRRAASASPGSAPVVAS